MNNPPTPTIEDLKKILKSYKNPYGDDDEVLIYRFNKAVNDLSLLITKAEQRGAEKAKQAKARKSITDWWIATEFFAQGGKKVAGPFKTRQTALKEREALEKRSATTYAIDSTKRKRRKLATTQEDK